MEPRNPPCANTLPSEILIVKRLRAISERTNEDDAVQAATTAVRMKNFIVSWVMLITEASSRTVFD
jgi:hypothetical protein